MRSDSILAGETLGNLSARCGVPACMLMRANGLYSPAWLLPGREIIIPEGRCEGAFPCPVRAFSRVIGRKKGRVILCLPGDSLASLAERFAVAEAEIRRLNRFDGDVYPGMELLIPDK